MFSPPVIFTLVRKAFFFESDLHDQVWKAGAHLTITEVVPFHTTLAAGYVHDRFSGPGAYGLIETSVRF
jgi:hypothetical protein